ncbi:tRNA (adenosine(37)-N6)-dimethylallyltransferase MiaA [Rhodoluna limnophila]|uniref:tRNA (adenosine(37)-N6)-dimethylallyltransferase MiaA n=1 Tax=Rhodoluna limnophila TaxID=232537 RepID=UPI0011065305|nr:tRNA (adenosine(37)-N6)-dimethylallyltransferase MiaA [Rhodoluna limnophila]
MKPKLIAVVGPTGSGKSNLAIEIATHVLSYGGRAEIINADSMQFYRGMDIGTAKLSVEERQGITHHLFDWLEITDESTAAEYQTVARPLIEELQAEGVVPILVGGSMLYVAAVLNNFEFPARDAQLRAQLEADLELVGPHELHRRLAAIDPVAAGRITPENGRRTVRALEIVTLTGQPFAAALPDEIVDWQPVLEIGTNGPREDLRARLEARVHQMWANGLLNEVERLIPLGVRNGKTSSRAIGYAQALNQIDGLMSEEEAIADTVRLTQKYARRQMSWFRRDPRINWLDYQDVQFQSKALQLVTNWLDL